MSPSDPHEVSGVDPEAAHVVASASRDDEQLAALVALAGLPNLGPSRFWSLLSGSAPTEAWQRVLAGRAPASGRTDDAAQRWQRWAASVAPAAVLDRHRTQGIDVVPFGAADFPSVLLEDPDPPVVLFRSGPRRHDTSTAVAIVGTRKCTRYGKDVAHELGALLAGRSIGVVSGLAHGIDAGAHAGAMTTDPSRCVAVVAGGLDVIYPRGNRHLWHEVRAHGQILSEWPLGAAPTRWRFPARNRLVAALSSVIVVVESAERGGSMYTVDEALRRDREVFAVPGSIRSPVSAGTNRLIADGAQVIVSAQTFADAFGHAPGPGRVGSAAAGQQPESWLLDVIGWDPVSFDVAVQLSGRSVEEVTLEVERLISVSVVRRFGALIERLA